MSGTHDHPESGVRDLRARQMETKADPWRDGNGPAEEGTGGTEADWQDEIALGQRSEDKSQVRHEPVSASQHSDRGREAGRADGEDRAAG